MRSAGGVAILAEGEHDGVDRHLVDAHEDVSLLVGDEHDDEDGEDGRGEVVGALRVGALVHVAHEEREDAADAGDDDLAEEGEEVADGVDDGDPRHVHDEKLDGVDRGVAVGVPLDRDEDVRVAVDVLEHLLEVPHAVLDAAHHVLQDGVALLHLLSLLVDVLEHRADELNHRDDERTERDGTNVVPHRAVDRAADRGLGHGLALPVVRRDGAGGEHDAEADDELRGPEDAEEVVHGHVLEIFIPLHFDCNCFSKIFY